MTGGGPLSGRRVVVTRGLETSDRLVGLLEAAGATVVAVPLITRVPLIGDAELAQALGRLRAAAGPGGARPWLVLTSAAAVGRMAAAAGPGGLDDVAVAVVGPATADALRVHGAEPALVAAGQEAASLAAELAARVVAGTRVLVVAAAGGRNVVAPALARSGAVVEVIEAYRTVMPEGAAERLAAGFAQARVDAITFTSGSTVRHAAPALPQPPRGCVAVCIGPVTARAARAAGWESVVTAAEHTAAGVVAAMIEHLDRAHPLP